MLNAMQVTPGHSQIMPASSGAWKGPLFISAPPFGIGSGPPSWAGALHAWQERAGGSSCLRRKDFIPDGLLNLFNKTARPVIAAESVGVRDSSQGVRVDVGARMRGMWR
jgi:hypothetical protein